jgi:hypothetical protein
VKQNDEVPTPARRIVRGGVPRTVIPAVSPAPFMPPIQWTIDLLPWLTELRHLDLAAPTRGPMNELLCELLLALPNALPRLKKLQSIALHSVLSSRQVDKTYGAIAVHSSLKRLSLLEIPPRPFEPGHSVVGWSLFLIPSSPEANLVPALRRHSLIHRARAARPQRQGHPIPSIDPVACEARFLLTGQSELGRIQRARPAHQKHSLLAANTRDLGTSSP